MGGITTSDDLRELAELRLEEARALLGHGLHSGAFYLAGYAVELALKAVLTSDLSSYSMPNKREVTSAYTHRLIELARAANLDPSGAGKPVRVAWHVATAAWAPDARYRKYGKVAAEEMVNSAEEIVSWLKAHW